QSPRNDRRVSFRSAQPRRFVEQLLIKHKIRTFHVYSILTKTDRGSAGSSWVRASSRSGFHVRGKTTAQSVFSEGAGVYELREVTRAASFGPEPAHCKAAERLLAYARACRAAIQVKVSHSKKPSSLIEVGGRPRVESARKRKLAPHSTLEGLLES